MYQGNSKYKGVSHPPSPHQATSIISSHTPFPPLVRRYVVQHSPSGPAKVACSVFGRYPLLPSGTAVRGTGLMPSPPPRRVIYPIAGPIPSSCPGTAVHGTALGDERDHTTAKQGKGEARHGALQPRTAPATTCTITTAKMIPTSLGATRRAFARPKSRPSHSTHNRTDLP